MTTIVRDKVSYVTSVTMYIIPEETSDDEVVFIEYEVTSESSSGISDIKSIHDSLSNKDILNETFVCTH